MNEGKDFLVKSRWMAGLAIAEIAREVGLARDTVVRSLLKTMRLSRVELLNADAARAAESKMRIARSAG